jgi:hypothetical protein
MPHQRVAAADDEAVDDVLDELGDHRARAAGPGQRPAGAVVGTEPGYFAAAAVPELGARGDVDDGVLAALHLRQMMFEKSCPFLFELDEAVEALSSPCDGRRRGLGARGVARRGRQRLGNDVHRVEAAHALDHADPRQAALLPLVDVGAAGLGSPAMRGS